MPSLARRSVAYGNTELMNDVPHVADGAAPRGADSATLAYGSAKLVHGFAMRVNGAARLVTPP